MTPNETADALRRQFGNAVQDVVYFRGEVSAVIETESIVDVARYCHDDLEYDLLSDVSCVDWLDRSPRFDVIYHLTSLPHASRFRLKVRTDEEAPVPTLSVVWGAANWPEREVWDLFGVDFAGHPDLRRLLLPDGWIGHPLRKDYPQTQIALPRPKSDKVYK